VAAPVQADVPPVTNFAEAAVSTGYNSAATTVIVASGQGAKFSATYPYPLVWWDCTTYTRPSLDPNVEIVLVTNRSTDTLTVTRGADGTSAVNHNTAGKVYCLIRTWVKYDVDQTRSSILSSSGGTEVYDASAYASFVAAVTALCTDALPHTLRVSAVSPVASNKTVCDNVLVQFIGAGRLDIATATTVTFSKPGQIFDPQRRTIFSWTGTGAVAFTEGGEVWPEWWGWTTSASAANGSTYSQKMINSLPANAAKASIIQFDGGTYLYDTKLPTNSRNVWLRGKGKFATHVLLTGVGSNIHGIYCTGTTNFLRVTDLDWSPFAVHTADNTQSGIRCDQANDAPSMPTGTIVEGWDLNLNGWNIAFYSDGGGSTMVKRSALYRSEITVGGSGSNAVNEGFNVLRSELAVSEDNYIAGANKADHCVYSLSNVSITFKRNICRDTLNEALKIITIASPATAVDPRLWIMEHNTMNHVGTCILINSAQAEVVDMVSLIGNQCDSVIGSLGSNKTAVYIQAHGTSRLKMVRLDGLSCSNVVNECINLEAITGSFIDQASLLSINVTNWGTSSPGLYSAISTSSAGTKGMMQYSGYFDGNSNGRQVLGPSSRSWWTVLDAGPVTFKNLTNTDENILTAQIGTGTSRAKVGGSIGRVVTAVSTSGTIDESLQSVAVPAGTFCENGKSIRVAASGIVAANANTKVIRLRLFGTQIITNDVTTAPNGTTWRIEGESYRTGSNTQRTNATMFVGSALQTQRTIDTACLEASDCYVAITGHTATAAGDITAYTLKVDYDN
jgi:hypothetical protein